MTVAANSHEEAEMKDAQLHELLFELLETELGGVLVYETALHCVQNPDLRHEWEEYHNQTKHHVQVAEELIRGFGLDPSTDTPGRRVVRHIGKSLVKAMEMALAEGQPNEAQLVAAECVTLAETKDHLNWELLGEASSHLKASHRKILQTAFDEVEDEEDEHLYHSTGWGRELWIEALGLAAVLPPPEERKAVKTAIGAARAKKARTAMASAGHS
jgi:bacterioferritin (cytochrome b1)